MGQIARLCLLRTPYLNGHGRNKEGLNAVWRTDREITHFPFLGNGEITHVQKGFSGSRGRKGQAIISLATLPHPRHPWAEVHLGWGSVCPSGRVLRWISQGGKTRQLARREQRFPSLPPCKWLNLPEGMTHDSLAESDPYLLTCTPLSQWTLYFSLYLLPPHQKFLAKAGRAWGFRLSSPGDPGLKGLTSSCCSAQACSLPRASEATAVTSNHHHIRLRLVTFSTTLVSLFQLYQLGNMKKRTMVLCIMNTETLILK